MQTPHILIVEDEIVTRNTLKSIFEAEGYVVHEATDGAEMHNVLSDHDINLVIMDINLLEKMVCCWRVSSANRQTWH